MIKKLMGAAVAAAVLTGSAGIFAAVPAANAAPALYLPFPDNVSTKVTNYPHYSEYGYYAVDFGLPRNSSVVASASGTVLVAAYLGGAYADNGLHVIIDHGNNFCTQYNHLASESVTVGQTVSRGQKIGTVGSTGLTSAGRDSTTAGEHLHWDRVNCSNRISVGPASSVEYPGGFYEGQTVTSQNSVVNPANPTIGSAGDLLAVDASGVLWNYPAAGNGHFETRVQIGPGWGSMVTGWTIDWTGDGVFDIVALWSDGSLRMYKGQSDGGFDSSLTIGIGWQNMQIAPSRFVKSDALPGLLAKDSSGSVWYYTNANGGALTTAGRTQVGWSWSAWNILPFDFNADSNQDVLAIDSTDTMRLYQGNGKGGWIGSPAQIGTGWSYPSVASSSGFAGAGTRGLYAQAADGQLYYYPVNGTGVFGARSLIGTGWTGYKIMNSQRLG